MSDRLLLDTMCGKLATYLRMCGYDAAYALDSVDADSEVADSEAADVEAADAPRDDELLDWANTEGRRLLTRDRELAARADDAVPLRTRDVREQLRELATAGFALELPDEPVRCSHCNGPLERVDGGEATADYAPEPDETDVWRCVRCGQHFWRGSHWDDVAETLAAL